MNVLSRLTKDFLNNFTNLNFSSNLGSYGDIVFQVSRGNVLTPEGIDLTISSKIEEHDNLGEAPYTEFIHRNLRSISLNIKLVYTLTDINDALLKLEKICENGEYYPLILGNKPLSKYGFILIDFKQGIKSTNSNGELEVVNCSLTLKEYIPKLDRLLLPTTNNLTTENKENTRNNNNNRSNQKNTKKNKKVLKKKSKTNVYSKNKDEKKWLHGLVEDDLRGY